MKKFSPLFFLAVAAAFPGSLRAQEDLPGAGEARLLRFPAIHGKTVVFTRGGDLYTVSAQGGIARRLTSHDGFEMFPRFSPDGKWLAFTGQYDGNTEVYVMPAEGGKPRRLTYTATLGRDDVSDRMGPNNIVLTWKNDREIVFRSRMREPNDFIGQLFTVAVDGGLPKQIPVPRGGFCSFSPDGKKMAYNRIFREFRTWKRYRGGMADEIWIHDFTTKKTTAITDDPAGDIIPMWAGDRIFFLSDRDGNKRFNLWSHDLKTGKQTQHTFFKDFDCKYPSLGNGSIVFENAGYIWRFDTAADKASRIPVRILEDDLGSRQTLKDVAKNIDAYEISPDGKRALFGARGDLFTVPAKEGPTRNLTGTSGVHDRNPKWSPDGKWVAYISDATGEDEIHLVAADGSGKQVQLTSGGPPYKYALHWSPDSKKIAWADKMMRLFVVDVASKKTTQIDRSKTWEIRQYAWSPDSRWLAYARYDEEGLQKVYLHSLDQGKSVPLTDGWYESGNPTFSGDGKYLFFVSERDFNPIYSATEWNHAYSDMQRAYVVLLEAKTPSPFRYKSDETAVKGDGKEETKDAKKGKEDDKKKQERKTPGVKIDLDGIGKRILQIPAPAGSYRNLASVGDSVYYIRGSRGSPSALHVYDLGAEKETKLGDVDGFEISANGKKMLAGKGGKYHIVDLPKGPLNLGSGLDLSGLQVQLDRRAEWRQIFHECWRQMRDFLYAPNMHGVDWVAIRKRYEPLVDHVHHRADLTYVIGEMISELGVGHAYVGGGDYPKAQRILTGLLGAELEQDARTKYYRIAKILPGSSWDKKLRSPLAEPGLNVAEGEFIVAVDGRPTNEMTNIYEALLGKVGKQVRLKIAKNPAEKGSRDVTVVPIGDEQPLYYHAWVQGNIRKVAEATKGKVGYLHVPDMLQNGLNHFARHFYPQLRKKALIIDVRGNGGGNVSPMLIERLRREIAMVDMARNTSPRPDPFDMLVGPKVCLMSEFSASDGDLFPYRFRHYKLGKLIGKRSWGGVVGIRGSLPLLDGGTLNKPEFASYSLDGKKWIIENHGVDPDIVVDNDPWLEFSGTDQQLDRAIDVILDELRRNERTLPPIPPFPKR